MTWHLSSKLLHSWLKLRLRMEWSKLRWAWGHPQISSSTPSIGLDSCQPSSSPDDHNKSINFKLVDYEAVCMEKQNSVQYLFCKRIGWCKISVALAVDGGARTPTNGIHLPVSVVVVHHVEVSMPASADSTSFCYHQFCRNSRDLIKRTKATSKIPRHPLDKAFTKVIEGNGDLHLLVSHIGITMAQEHNLLKHNNQVSN